MAAQFFTYSIDSSLRSGSRYGTSSSSSKIVTCYYELHDQVYGNYIDGGDNTIADVCPPSCPDFNGDGYVNVNDILILIGYWGASNSPADVNSDGIVDVADLLILIAAWGPCE